MLHVDPDTGLIQTDSVSEALEVARLIRQVKAPAIAVAPVPAVGPSASNGSDAKMAPSRGSLPRSATAQPLKLEVRKMLGVLLAKGVEGATSDVIAEILGIKSAKAIYPFSTAITTKLQKMGHEPKDVIWSRPGEVKGLPTTWYVNPELVRKYGLEAEAIMPKISDKGEANSNAGTIK